jgi:hypothetical protein
MHRRTKKLSVKLSVDDKKAIDVVLDHAALGGKTGLTRMATPVQQRHLSAATKLLSLLSELPETEPPANLVAKTMAKIDQHTARQMGHRVVNPVSVPTNVH